MALGGGYETQGRYGKEVDTIFLDLPNIHDIVKEFEKLRDACAQTQRVALTGEHPMLWAATQHSSPDDDGWQKRRRKLIRASAHVAMLLDRGTSVLVHCTDGWDRTPQVVTLAKMMLDSHYRTVRGFCELVEREWVQMGHRFADRNCGPVPVLTGGGGGGGGAAAAAFGGAGAGAFAAVASATTATTTAACVAAAPTPMPTTQAPTTSPPTSTTATAATAAAAPINHHDLPDWCRHPDAGSDIKPQVSPIFFQWLDAVRERVEMFPSRFEFTSVLLSNMLNATYSGEYGTFACNTQRQRCHPLVGLSHRAASFWTEVAKAVEDEVGVTDVISPQQSGGGGGGGGGGSGGVGGGGGGARRIQCSSRFAECPGCDDLPLVNPQHADALRDSLLASLLQRHGTATEGDASGADAAAETLVSPAAAAASNTNAVGRVDDGSVLVPIFDSYGAARSVWTTWLVMIPRWNRFADATSGKHYVITSAEPHKYRHHQPAGTVPDSTTALQRSIELALSSSSSTNTTSSSSSNSTTRLFPDAEASSERHRRMFLAPSESAASAHGGGGVSRGAAAASGHVPHHPLLPLALASSATTALANQFVGTTSHGGFTHFAHTQQQQRATTPLGGGAGAGPHHADPHGDHHHHHHHHGQQYHAAEPTMLPLRDRDNLESCYNCKKTFSLFQRRHTCRACCRSVCVDCGSKFAVVPPGLIRDKESREIAERRPGTAMRLCDGCFLDISEC